MATRILKDLFDKLGVEYDTINHPYRDTALATAMAEGEDPSHVAKVVVVDSRGKHKMFVIPSDRRLDLFKAADALGDDDARVIFESEMTEDFPDSEVGAEPPLGSIYGLPVFVDAGLTTHPEIVFSAGTHTESFKMKTEDYISLASPQIGDYAVPGSKGTMR